MVDLLPALPVSSKRVVLLHTNGPYAGLYQIIGHASEFGTEAPPTYIEDWVSPPKRWSAVSLVAAKPRFLLYREVPLQADGQHYPVRVR